MCATPPNREPGASPPPRETCDDLLDDGQEEVFSRQAVSRGLVRDPLALGPVGDDPGSPPDAARPPGRPSQPRA